MEAETRWTLGWSTTLGPRAIAAIAAPGVTKFLGPRASAAIAAPGVTKLLGPRAIAAIAAPGVTKRTHDDQGRAPPPDALHVRSPRGTLAARGAAAAGGALPHADRELFAQREAVEALPQLAAGPVRQLGGAPSVPGEVPRARDHGRPRRRHDRNQPVRLLRRPVGGEIPVRLRQRQLPRAGALPRADPRDAAPHGLGAQGAHALPRHADQHHRPAHRREPPGARGRELP